MSDRAFLDTNVLVYALGERDDRTPVAEGLLAAGGVISLQVLNELASVAHRTLKMSSTRALDVRSIRGES